MNLTLRWGVADIVIETTSSSSLSLLSSWSFETKGVVVCLRFKPILSGGGATAEGSSVFCRFNGLSLSEDELAMGCGCPMFGKLVFGTGGGGIIAWELDIAAAEALVPAPT